MALGIVIDDAVNDVRNILRRLREHRVAGTETSGKSTAAIVLEAALERRSAIGYATLIALLAVVPVFLMTGLAGAFFKPLVLSYVAAVVASSVVALTVTAALSRVLLARSTARGTRVPSHPVAAARLRPAARAAHPGAGASVRHRRYRRVGRRCGVAGARAAAGPFVPGHESADQLGGYARHVPSGDGPDHDQGECRAAIHSGGPERRGARGAGRHGLG